MDSGKPRKGFINTSRTATAAALVLLVGWSMAAQGATQSVVACDGGTRELSSLNVATEALAATLSMTLPTKRVDHSPGESEPASLATVEAQSEAQDANAPLLYLTPRVANLLRDVFQGSGEEAPQSGADKTPSSPVADRSDDRLHNRSENSGQIEQGTENRSEDGVIEEILPRFQQRMYRKDI